MRKELEKKLVERFPTWFDVTGDVRRTLMRSGFQCGDGWFETLWRLCVDLEPLVTELERETVEPFEVVKVKQKFGGFRFYVNRHTDSIDQRIAQAREECSRTCEVCGQPGVQRETGGLFQTACEEHAERQEQQ